MKKDITQTSEYKKALNDWVRAQNFRGENGKFRKPTDSEIAEFTKKFKAAHSVAKDGTVRKKVATSREKPMTMLQRLEKQARAKNIEKHSQASYDWFSNTLKQKIGKNRARETMIQDGKKMRRMRDTPLVGKMYTYVYDAKHKDKLPYWDAFPLIFMVGPAAGGFYGINLHYLPPKPRAQLFDALLEITNNKSFTSSTKLNVTYSLLKNSAKFKLFKPCFKHYLLDHVQSQLVYIHPEEWEAALFLPSANFQKAGNSEVWTKSLHHDMINGKGGWKK